MERAERLVSGMVLLPIGFMAAMKGIFLLLESNPFLAILYIFLGIVLMAIGLTRLEFFWKTRAKPPDS